MKYLIVILRVVTLVAGVAFSASSGTAAISAPTNSLRHEAFAATNDPFVLIRGQQALKPAIKGAAKQASKAIKESVKAARGKLGSVLAKPKAKFEAAHPSSIQARAPPTIIQNRLDGQRREREYYETLKKEHPDATIIKQADLRNSKGEIVKDVRRTKTGRRIDFVVVENGKVIKSVEVTSLTAPKDRQILKERRIRQDYGGNYVRDPNSKKLYILKNMETGKNIDTDIVRLP